MREVEETEADVRLREAGERVGRAREERERIRAACGELFAEMAAILARHDLVGLAPRNRYEPEVGTVLPRLAEAADASEVQRILHEEFDRWFDPDIRMAPEAEFATAANEIWMASRRLPSPSDA